MDEPVYALILVYQKHCTEYNNKILEFSKHIPNNKISHVKYQINLKHNKNAHQSKY